ncbi:uncharacterized protein [Diadema antillarum]|uniref:uncharacterized protein isoform X1 n=1 Tax=Diadema antillarum TaxID=105358 RepID=UPI003A8C5C84
MLSTIDDGPTDLVFLLDSSSSIGAVYYERLVYFVKAASQILPVSPDKTRIAIVSFSSCTKIHKFIDYITQPEGKNKCTLNQDIDSTVRYDEGGRCINHALQRAGDVLARGRRINRIIIVLIAGASSDGGSPLNEAQELRNRGITILSIGLGSGVDVAELEGIASSPDQHVFYLSQLGDVSSFADVLRSDVRDDDYWQVNDDACPSTCGPNSMCACATRSGILQCVCNAGFYNTIIGCTEIDECASNPCLNGGTCNDLINGFSCNCSAGRTGEYCGIEIDECASNPCLNGGTCNDLINGFSCNCTAGWVGAYCGTDIYGCFSKPCLNAGICRDLLDGFECECPSGYEGKLCERDLDECMSEPCLNGGSCENLHNNFSCNCSRGWSGERCQTVTGFCASNPCANGATCLPSTDECICTGSFAGRTCTIPVARDGIPKVTQHPISTPVDDVRVRVELQCSFEGVVRFHWQKGSLELPDTADRESLVIEHVAPRDQGYYRCVGTTADGQRVESNPALVRVTDLMTFPITMKLLRMFTPSLVDPESEDYKNIVGNLTSNTVKSELERKLDIGSTVFLHVNRLHRHIHSVTVNMTVYIGNSSLLSPTNVSMAVHNWLREMANYTLLEINVTSINVRSTEVCLQTSWRSAYGTVVFPAGPIHSRTTSSGKCPWYTINAEQPIARALCHGDYISACLWQPEDNCGKNITADEQIKYLEQSLEDHSLEENPQAVLSQVASITEESAEISSAGVQAVSGILKEAADLETTSTQSAGEVVSILNNLADVDDDALEEAQESDNAPNVATQSLESVLLNLNVSANETFQNVEPNIAVQVLSLSSPKAKTGLVFGSFGDVSAALTESNVKQLAIDEFEETPVDVVQVAAIVIPPEVLSHGKDGNIALTVYHDDSLFVQRENTSEPFVVPSNRGDTGQKFFRQINTNVIAASFGEQAGTSRSLDTPVTIVLTHKKNASNPRCVFWNYTDNSWSTAGCTLKNTSSEARSECECNHLTNFAVLMDIHAGRWVGTTVDKVYEILTYVGCAFSIFGLMVTLATYLSNRKLRQSQPNRILMCLCGTLLSLYVLFIIMSLVDGHLKTKAGVCGLVAGLVHFSMLSAVAWMGVEGVNMFYLLVRVVNSYIPRFMLKAGVVAWGVPALIVILTGAIAKKKYISKHFCFLGRWSMVSGLMVPMGIILLVNMVIFVMVIYRLTRTNIATRARSSGKEDGYRDVLRRCQNAVSIFLLLGLTWVLGYFTLIRDDNLVIHVLFVILNSLQGFFIFVLYCLRQQHFRDRMGRYRESLRRRFPRLVRRVNLSAPCLSSSRKSYDVVFTHSQSAVNTQSTIPSGTYDSKEQYAMTEKGNTYCI